MPVPCQFCAFAALTPSRTKPFAKKFRAGKAHQNMLFSTMSDQISTDLPPDIPSATPAATIVVMRRNPEGGAPLVLMVERVKSMSFAGGAVVFPGGKVDSADFAFAGMLDHGLDHDEAAARLAAIRETIEEAGLALALHGVADPADCADARAALHAGDSLEQICARHGWTPALDQLIPWARWRPPGFEIRIFDTRFYLVDAGEAASAASVDNSENISLFWESAAGVLERAERGEVRAIFPTKRNLERLALFDSFDAAAAHAAEYPVKMLLTYTEDRDGQMHICLPDGFGYPVLSEAVSPGLRG
jgi:8-oxo-dGTP pyrophosphatase MutT (NUDIX family)